MHIMCIHCAEQIIAACGMHSAHAHCSTHVCKHFLEWQIHASQKSHTAPTKLMPAQEPVTQLGMTVSQPLVYEHRQVSIRAYQVSIHLWRFCLHVRLCNLPSCTWCVHTLCIAAGAVKHCRSSRRPCSSAYSDSCHTPSLSCNTPS